MKRRKRMIVYKPVKINDNLFIIQILTDNRLQSHKFKQEFEAFKFYNSFNLTNYGL